MTRALRPSLPALLKMPALLLLAGTLNAGERLAWPASDDPPPLTPILDPKPVEPPPQHRLMTVATSGPTAPGRLSANPPPH